MPVGSASFFSSPTVASASWEATGSASGPFCCLLRNSVIDER